MLRLFQFIIVASAFIATSSFSPVASPRVWGKSSSVVLNAAVIEKEAPFKTKGPAVLEPETETGTPRKGTDRTEKRERSGNEAWEVRIYNDGLNTREHVARSLVQITGLSEITAYNTMMQAHQNGMAVVGTWVYEVAEMYHDALRKQGIVCDLVPVDGDKWGVHPSQINLHRVICSLSGVEKILSKGAKLKMYLLFRSISLRAHAHPASSTTTFHFIASLQ